MAVRERESKSLRAQFLSTFSSSVDNSAEFIKGRSQKKYPGF